MNFLQVLAGQKVFTNAQVAWVCYIHVHVQAHYLVFLNLGWGWGGGGNGGGGGGGGQATYLDYWKFSRLINANIYLSILLGVRT